VLRAENSNLSHQKTAAGRIPLPSKKITCQNKKTLENFPFCVSKKNRFCDIRASFSKPEIISWINRATLWTPDITLWTGWFFLSIEKKLYIDLRAE
jgi:hypothetical protein